MTINIVFTYTNADKSIPPVYMLSNEQLHTSCWPPSNIPSVFSYTICMVNLSWLWKKISQNFNGFTSFCHPWLLKLFFGLLHKVHLLGWTDYCSQKFCFEFHEKILIKDALFQFPVIYGTLHSHISTTQAPRSINLALLDRVVL
jgi:hypothetical protein